MAEKTIQAMYRWRAGRSGPGITATGCDTLGRPMRVTDIRLLEPSPAGQPCVVGVTKTGQRFALMTQSQPKA